MIIETLLYNQLQDLNRVEHFEDNSDDVVVTHKNKQWCNPKLKVYLLIVLKILSTSIAVYLAWDCNRRTRNKLFKYLIIILAALFSDFYILFYFVYRIMLNNQCNAPKGAKLAKKAVLNTAKTITSKFTKVKAPKLPKTV